MSYAQGSTASPGAALPSKPVQVIVPNPPGGGPDFIARLIAPKLSEALRQNVIVENRTSANGIVGTEFAARGAPAGTPCDIIRRLNEETAKVMHSTDTRNKLVADGTEVVVSSPEAFEKVLVTEIAKWAKVIKAANVKAE